MIRDDEIIEYQPLSLEEFNELKWSLVGTENTLSHDMVWRVFATMERLHSLWMYAEADAGLHRMSEPHRERAHALWLEMRELGWDIEFCQHRHFRFDGSSCGQCDGTAEGLKGRPCQYCGSGEPGLHRWDCVLIGNPASPGPLARLRTNPTVTAQHCDHSWDYDCDYCGNRKDPAE